MYKVDQNDNLKTRSQLTIFPNLLTILKNLGLFFYVDHEQWQFNKSYSSLFSSTTTIYKCAKRIVVSHMYVRTLHVTLEDWLETFFEKPGLRAAITVEVAASLWLAAKRPSDGRRTHDSKRLDGFLLPELFLLWAVESKFTNSKSNRKCNLREISTDDNPNLAPKCKKKVKT